MSIDEYRSLTLRQFHEKMKEIGWLVEVSVCKKAKKKNSEKKLENKKISNSP